MKVDFKKNIEKLRALSDFKKKIILFSVVIVLGVIMGYFWIKSTAKRIDLISKEIGKINIPSLDLIKTTTPSNAEIIKTK